MKILLFLIAFLPLVSKAQSFNPEILYRADTSITGIEHVKDTQFVYRQVKTPHWGCLVNGCTQEWNIYKDRQVFIILNKQIKLLRVDRPKYRDKEVVEKKIITEEYW